MVLRFLDQYKDIGLLILRIGLGGMFIFHGVPIMFGGPETWEKVGVMGMSPLGIEFMPAFWGFIAGVAEFTGGICLILGLFFRPACIFLTLTMGAAVIMHLKRGDTLGGASHAIENGIVFFSLIFIGPGKYSLEGAWHAQKHSDLQD
jgi:putative oxidoreductase